MQPIARRVYLPVEIPRHSRSHIFDLNECEGSFIGNVAEERGYFFTPNELDEYKADIVEAAMADTKSLVQLSNVGYEAKIRELREEIEKLKSQP